MSQDHVIELVDRPAVEFGDSTLDSKTEDEKTDLTVPVAIEHEDYGLPVMGESGLLKSRLDQLSLLQTLWVFRRATGYCVLMFAWAALEGWESSISGQVVAMKGFTEQFGTVKGESGVLALDTRWLSAWGAATSVGQLITLTYIAYVANRWGKKVGFYWCWTCFATGLIIMCNAKRPVTWFFARLIIGLGGGVSTILVGPYIMEVAPNRIRGGIYFFPWTACSQITCSVMMEQVNLKYPHDWRLPIYLLWITTGLMGIFILFVPESPWYLARHGKKEQCLKVFKRLYGNIPEYNYEEEYAILEKTLHAERQLMELSNARPWNDIFKGPSLRKTMILLMLNFGAVFSGTSIMSTYGSYFFTLAGLNNPFLVGIIQAVVTAAFSALWAVMIDRVGRRPPYLIALGMQCGIMWIIGGLFYIHTPGTGGGLIFLSSLWSIAFGMMGCVNYAMYAELPSATLRMKTVTFAAAVNGILAICASEFTPPLLTKLNLRAGFIYAAITFPVFLLALYYLPESKGRSAAEIDELFERRIKAWKWAKTVTEVENHLHSVVVAETKDEPEA